MERYNEFVMSSRVARVTCASVRYGRIVVLDGVSLNLDDGEIIAARGANGAGSSTLLRALVDAFDPRSGKRTGPSPNPSCPGIAVTGPR